MTLMMENSRPKIGNVAHARLSKDTQRQDARLTRAERKRLVRVINIDDFEAAAQGILSPKHFACKASIPKSTNNHLKRRFQQLTVHSLQSRRRFRNRNKMELEIMGCHSFPSPHP